MLFHRSRGDVSWGLVALKVSWLENPLAGQGFTAFVRNEASWRRRSGKIQPLLSDSCLDSLSQAVSWVGWRCNNEQGRDNNSLCATFKKGGSIISIENVSRSLQSVFARPELAAFACICTE